MSKPIDLKNLDFNDAGNWPTPVKAAAATIIGLLVLLLAWYLVISDKSDVLANLKAKETELRSSFEVKQARASDLEPSMQQLPQTKAMLHQIQHHLPSHNALPDLIDDHPKTAMANGPIYHFLPPRAEDGRGYSDQ